MFAKCVLATILAYLSLCDTYKILVVFPFPAKSHNNLGNGIVRHLLKAGHEVTYITPYPIENPHSNLHQVDVSQNKNYFPEDAINLDKLMKDGVQLNDDNFMFFSTLKVAEKTLENVNVQEFLNDPKEQFDVVVAEWMFNEVYCGLSAVFACPYIWAFPYEPHSRVMSLIDEHTNPAYVPNFVSNNVAPYGFLQRIHELWKQIAVWCLQNFYWPKFEREIYEKSFGHVVAKRGRQLPAYYDLRYNVSIMLGNSHVSLGQANRLPQNYKIIGGYYIDKNAQPLPEDLQKIMDNAKNGVIYFSLGSNLKSKDLAVDLKVKLMKMFSELKQTVIWKFEEEFHELPKNVYIIKWAPQQSILSHPNCILFITHGGLLSTTETVHNGIPFIGIPVFGDQFNNVDRAVKKGFAKRVDISYSLAEDLQMAIDEIISDSRYEKKAKELSLIYHDRPLPPGKELVHWVEHVVRTRGAPHLRSPALMVPWYQKMYLDLAAVITICLVTMKICIKWLYILFFVKKTNIRKKKI